MSSSAHHLAPGGATSRPTADRRGAHRSTTAYLDASLGRRRRSLGALVTLVALGCATLGLAAIGAPMPWASAQLPPPAQSIEITGSGWGHGVGMSQYGARGRALAGADHAAILGAYYPGATLTNQTFNDSLWVRLDRRATTTVRVRGTARLWNGAGHLGWIGDGGVLAIWRQNDVFWVTLNGINLCGGTGCGGTSITIARDYGTTLDLVDTNTSYQHGHMVVFPSSTGTTVDTVLAWVPLEAYLHGVREMPASWPAAALRAQAVAARTVAVRSTTVRRASPSWNEPYDLVASTSDQVYRGDGDAPSAANWIAAVDQTAGQMLTHGGRLIEAVYSSSNGGHSEASSYVWSGNLPYLSAFADPFDADGNPNATWRRTFDGVTLGRLLGRTPDTAVGDVVDLWIGGDVGPSGRVDRADVTIVGTQRTITIRGSLFRIRLNSAIQAEGGRGNSVLILSTKFTLAVTPGGDPPTTTAPPAATTPSEQAETAQIPTTATDAQGQAVAAAPAAQITAARRGVDDQIQQKLVELRQRDTVPAA